MLDVVGEICDMMHLNLDELLLCLCLCLCNFFRRPPLADDIGIKYTMLDPTFDKGHRARFIENRVVSNFLKTKMLNR